MESSRNMPTKWQHQVKVFNDAIKSLEIIKPLADKFNGKVINKRFTTAMNEVADTEIVRFSIHEKGYNRTAKVNEKVVAMYLCDRGFKAENGWEYIDEDNFEVREFSDTDFYINADGRLVKDFFIHAVDNMIEYFKRRIAEYQDCIDNFDKYLEEIANVNKQINELKKKLHYPMSIQTYKLELPFWY